MGRVYERIIANGEELYTLFDTGSVSSYITRKAARRVKLVEQKLPEPILVGLGGRKRRISGVGILVGEIKGNRFHTAVRVVGMLGKSEKGQEIDLIFGALSMQEWNILIDPKKEKLDLSRFKKEWIEYYLLK